MKKIFRIFIFFMIISEISFSWSGHAAYTYYLVQDLPCKNDLISITEYSYEEDRVYNEEYLILEDVAGTRKFIDTAKDVNIPPDPIPINNQIPVW